MPTRITAEMARGLPRMFVRDGKTHFEARRGVAQREFGFAPWSSVGAIDSLTDED